MPTRASNVLVDLLQLSHDRAEKLVRKGAPIGFSIQLEPIVIDQSFDIDTCASPLVTSAAM